MQEYIVRLYPQSMIASLNASMLFGAVCWSLRDLYGEKFLVDALEQFAADQPPFVLSEPLPWFYGNDQAPLYFWPCPLLPPQDLFMEGREGAECLHLYRKYQRFRRIMYFSQEVFASWAQGIRNEQRIFEELEFYDHRASAKSESPLVGLGAFAMTREEYARWPLNMAHQRRFGEEIKAKPLTTASQYCVRLDRVNQTSTPFYRQALWVGAGGYYLFLRCNEEWRLHLERAMAVLGRQGIGRNRSIGWGRFTSPHFENAALPWDPQNLDPARTFYMTLSRTIPTAEEAQKISRTGKSCYRIVPYQGYTHGVDRSARRKTPVYFLEAGSLFEISLHGRCLPLPASGSAKVLQYGLAYCIAVGPQNGDCLSVKGVTHDAI